jgi:formylglycine-generating enzyme required for sulfatase activity
VVGVSWADAQAFCVWLSKKEGKTYRLPTDEEWSIAAGLGQAEKRTKDTTPAMLTNKESTEFPWGGDFPPKSNDMAGNYSDESRKAKAHKDVAKYLEGYDDGYPTTAPVMSFKPNKLGLYDLGGNLWEWCEDWYDHAQQERVLRGGCWTTPERILMLSSVRHHNPPTNRSYGNGFRVVLVGSGG